MTNWNVLVNLLCRSHARARGVFFVAIAAGPTGGSAAPSSFTRGGRAGAGGRSGRRRRRFRFQLCAVGSGMELSRSGRAGMRAPPGARYELDYRAHLLACPRGRLRTGRTIGRGTTRSPPAQSAGLCRIGISLTAFVHLMRARGSFRFSELRIGSWAGDGDAGAAAAGSTGTRSVCARCAGRGRRLSLSLAGREPRNN